jgi:isopenicillin N synthase-like dioxygenase
MSTVNIPRLDLDTYKNGDAESRKRFSDAIGAAFNETGFVTITNHGLSKELIDSLYQQVKSLFALPEDVKLKYEKPELAGQRGYTSKGKETAKGFKVPDLKEFWQIGQTVTDGDPIKEQYPDNVYVIPLPAKFTRSLKRQESYYWKPSPLTWGCRKITLTAKYITETLYCVPCITSRLKIRML